jgi:CoA:oxalate CoA-transferase
MTRPLPLQGLTVVELSDEPAGELCGALLAGLGAAVTKLRSGTEDAARRMGATEAERRLLDTLVNGAKQIRSLASLEPAGAAGLLAAADVVVVGWEPGHDQPPPGFAEFDLSPAQRSERTVVCQISAFGEDGPLSGTVASDLILQAARGVMATTGEPGGGPLRPSAPSTGSSASALPSSNATAPAAARSWRWLSSTAWSPR